MGHEFSGEIVEVGEEWKDQFSPGDKYAIQPALNYKGSPYAPGYSFEFLRRIDDILCNTKGSNGAWIPS